MAQNSKDYKNGKIYCIRNKITDDIYVGSTTQPLSKRMAKHRQNAKCENRMHYIFYSKVNERGLENFYIELIEDCPCESLEQLRKREGHYIREMGTLNHKIAGRTGKEWEQDNKEKRKEYFEQNKDKIKEYHTEYHT
jgi:group I intron endonuclease